MAGIKATRVDYGDKGGAKMDDKLSKADPQDSSVPKPIRAGVPIKGSENENTVSDSKASLATRPTTAGDKGGYKK